MVKLSERIVGFAKDQEQENEIELSATSSTSVLELSAKEAKSFFLKSESYCSFDLPPYFNFSKVIAAVHKELEGKELSSLRDHTPRNYSDINYKILSNKDGKYSWRPIQLIHPVLYVSLVNKITEEENWKLICDRFKALSNNKQIECLSVPRNSNTKKSDKAEQVLYWWNNVEQRSLELSLEYDHIIHTDITDCYGSIYTHSVAWAMHEKDFMKIRENRENKRLIGNIVDNHLQDMSHGQTNGISQGSMLMDFIAELVLVYMDCTPSAQVGQIVHHC